MSRPTLYGLNKAELGPHILMCADRPDAINRGSFLHLFIGQGNSLFAPLTWIPKVQTYKAVLKYSAPPSPTELTPTILFNVLKHLQQIPQDSPCYEHTFYLDTATAHLVFCRTNQVPRNNNTVDLMGSSMGINRYYLSDTIDGTTGDPEGRVRVKKLIIKTLDAIAAAQLKASTPGPVLGASMGTQLQGTFQRISGPAQPSSGPTYSGSFPVASGGRGGVGGPWGATSLADPYDMGCDR